MAIGREIKSKINSIKNTQKITRAMELVAASKMRKARERVEKAKPYADKAAMIVSHVAKANLEYKHPYFEHRDLKKLGIIIVSTDRGLCGGLNINLFKEVIKILKEAKKKNVEVVISTIGAKAESFFKNLKVKIISSAIKLGDKPSISDLIGSVKVMLDSFDNEEIDKLLLISNEFVNTIKQKPLVTQLLPIIPIENKELDYHWDYIYEPEAKQVLDILLVRYVESQTYRGVIENLACEQASRMIAMKNATDNAKNMIKSLNLKYNKARQAAITQELSEIIAGASSV